jgi:predicted nucleotidyltransferase
MNAADALATLRQSEPALRSRGVAHAAVFGSVARGDNRPDYVGVKAYIATLFAEPVDVIDREALKPHLRLPATRDAFYAF